MATTEVDKLVVRLTAETSQYVKGVQKAGKTTEYFTRDARGRLRDFTGKLITDQQRIQMALANTNNKFRRAILHIQNYGFALKSAGASMTSMGSALTMRVTLPLGIFAGMGVRAFAQFDQAMVESTSIMQTTGDQVERMRNLAIGLSNEGPRSATELAESYFFLASAGKDAEQSMKLLPKVQDFAIAGAFDLATATDLLTDAQSALGMTSKDVAEDTRNLVRVSDVLVKANTLANASVEQFSKALTTKAGAALKAFNKDIEEGVAVLAAFADQGVKSELAGTQLDRVFRLLSKSSMDNAKEHKRLGFSVFDSSGEMRHMADIVGNLEDIMKDMSAETKVATLDMLGFEARVQQAILPLLGTSEAIREYYDETKKANGITKEIADKQMQSFSNQMKVAWNNVKNMAASIGEQLVPMVKSIGQWVKEWTRWWSRLDSGTKSLIVNIGLTAAAVGPLTLVLGKLFVAIGAASTAMGALTIKSIASKAALGSIATAGIAAAFVHVKMKAAEMNAEFERMLDLAGQSRSKIVQDIVGKEGAERAAELKKRLVEATDAVELLQMESQKIAGPRKLKDRYEGTILADNTAVEDAAAADDVGVAQQRRHAARRLNAAKDHLWELRQLQDKFRREEANKDVEAQKQGEQARLEEARLQLETQQAMNDKAIDLLGTLDMQLQTMGMTATEAQIFALEQERAEDGVTRVNEELIEQLRIRNDLLAAQREANAEAKRAAQKQEQAEAALQRDAEALTKKHQGIHVTYFEQTEYVNKLLQQGRISKETAKKEYSEIEKTRADAQKQLDDATKPKVSGPGTASVRRGTRVGTADYFRSFARAQGREQKTTEEKQLTAAERAADALDVIKDNLQPANLN